MASRGGGDAAIKLFGRTIPLLDTSAEVRTKLACDARYNYGTPCIPDKLLNVNASSCHSKNSNEIGSQTISNQHGETETDSKSDEAKPESDRSGQEKVLKKPDHILPCARCNSMETKFCYYNNYNVNQPRHFCRNCQRYWTAGGTMRNVPVGAGRRKNKHPSHHRHATKPCDNNMATSSDVSDATHHQSLPVNPSVLPGPGKRNEAVSESGSGVCFSTTPVLNSKEQNNTHVISLASGDNKEEKSCASSAAVSGCSENWMPHNTSKKEPNYISGNSNNVRKPHPHIQSYPGGPALAFPWSSGWNSGPVMAPNQCSSGAVHVLENGSASSRTLLPPPLMPAPGICAPSPFPLVPPFWSNIPGWPNGMLNMWTGRNDTALQSLTPNNSSSRNNSSALGKRSREVGQHEEEKTEKKTLWIPKTLRIDDPDQAAKSSIWAALGIKHDEKGILKSFQSKVLKDGKTPGSPQALQANPAAFSRSQSFQEKS
ncbi:hypothetical protein ACP4OV_020602 [Aristida adscensionis]